MNTNGQKGFTLIELLVVIGIIGTLSGIVLASLNTSRTKGADAAIKLDIKSVTSQAELYHLNNGTYGVYSQATCPTTTGGGTSVFQNDTRIIDIIKHGVATGNNGSSCFSSAEVYAVAIGLKTAGQSMCIDNNKIIKQFTGTPAQAITAGVCN